MVFSEDDLLPYKRIPFQNTPEYFKSVFMQWTMLDQEDQIGFVTDISAETLCKMACLDMSDFAVNRPSYLGQSFAASFDQQVTSAKAEIQRKEARLRELLPEVLRLFTSEEVQVKEMRARVESLLDEEMKGTTIPSEGWKERNVRSKASILIPLSSSDQHIISGSIPNAQADSIKLGNT
jgi:hypothetical protein